MSLKIDLAFLLHGNDLVICLVILAVRVCPRTVYLVAAASSRRWTAVSGLSTTHILCTVRRRRRSLLDQFRHCHFSCNTAVCNCW